MQGFFAKIVGFGRSEPREALKLVDIGFDEEGFCPTPMPQEFSIGIQGYPNPLPLEGGDDLGIDVLAHPWRHAPAHDHEFGVAAKRTDFLEEEADLRRGYPRSGGVEHNLGLLFPIGQDDVYPRLPPYPGEVTEDPFVDQPPFQLQAVVTPDETEGDALRAQLLDHAGTIDPLTPRIPLLVQDSIGIVGDEAVHLDGPVQGRIQCNRVDHSFTPCPSPHRRGV